MKTSFLREIADIVDSLHKTPKYSISGYPMVRVVDVKYGILNLSKTKKVNDKVYSEFSRRYEPEVDDIIITRVGSYGISALVKETEFCLGQNTAALKPKIDKRYLYYVLNSPALKREIEYSTVGSTQKTLSLKAIGNLKIPRFDKRIEKLIGETLSSIDNKVQNNLSMNKTLQEMAMSIFKSWFVDFDPAHAKAAGNTPSHMNAETVALFPSSFSDDGLPIKWEQRKISKFANALLGGTPSRNNSSYWGGDIPWINSGAVNKFRILEATELISKGGFKNSSTKLLPINTTVIAITGATLGQVSYLEIEACANQSVVGVISNKDYASEWVYLSFLSNIDRLTNLQTGGAQQHINKNDVLNFKIVYPTEEIISSFSAIVRPLFQKIANALRENQTLSELRDTLIPKLMSDEIRIKDAEREVEASI